MESECSICFRLISLLMLFHCFAALLSDPNNINFDLEM